MKQLGTAPIKLSMPALGTRIDHALVKLEPELSHGVLKALDSQLHKSGFAISSERPWGTFNDKIYKQEKSGELKVFTSGPLRVAARVRKFVGR